MKVLVTGVSGQLGYDVMKELEKRGLEGRGVGIEDFSLTDEAAVRDYVLSYKPEAIIHCAAYTAVDKAEDDYETCEAVNVTGTRNIVQVAGEIGAKCAYISTDYVFPGTGYNFYETFDPTAPCNAYGRSKLGGENEVRRLEAHFIVRTSWVFGKNGHNFVKTMLKLSQTHDELKVVDDQIGSPTYTPDLAQLLVDLIRTKRYGIYHGTNEGICSWAEFAAEIFRQAGKHTRVVPVPSTEYPTRAIRPKNSRLSKRSLDSIGFRRLPMWHDALGRYLAELREAGEL